MKRVKKKTNAVRRRLNRSEDAEALLKRLAAEQGIKPTYDLAKLGAPLAVEPDPDAMYRFIMEERAARRRTSRACRNPPRPICSTAAAAP